MFVINIFATTIYVILIIGVILVILGSDGEPGRKLAWLLVIAILPILGLVLYFLFGIDNRGHWYFNKRHVAAIDALHRGLSTQQKDVLFGEGALSKVREDFRPLAKLLSRSGMAVTEGNDMEIIASGPRKFDLLMDDLSRAEHYIHIEYFHFGDDESSTRVKNLLMKKASEGVKVRFLYENIANFPIRARFYNDMRYAGVEVLKFTNPRAHLFNLVTKLNYRNHRKIVVIDGRIGYTGGMNINDHYFKLWRDTHLRVQGDAVLGLQYTFMESWLTAGGYPSGSIGDYFPLDDGTRREPISGPEQRPLIKDNLLQIRPDEPDGDWPMIQLGYEWVINAAKKYIYLQTPYFVPPESILNALKSAALRGVDVRLMLPLRADNVFMRPTNKSYFTECLEAGVRIFLRGGEFIHSKTFVCDDYVSSIGSANLDYRSFNINYEVNTYIYGETAALASKALFTEDERLCTEVRLDLWNTRHWSAKLLERVMRLFSPLL